jgi:hypothetical protein
MAAQVVAKTIAMDNYILFLFPMPIKVEKKKAEQKHGLSSAKERDFVQVKTHASALNILTRTLIWHHSRLIF